MSDQSEQNLQSGGVLRVRRILARFSPLSLSLLLLLAGAIYPTAVVFEYLQSRQTPYAFIERDVNYSRVLDQIVDSARIGGFQPRQRYTIRHNSFIIVEIATSPIVQPSLDDTTIRTRPSQFEVENSPSRSLSNNFTETRLIESARTGEILATSASITLDGQALTLYIGLLLTVAASVYVVYSQIQQDQHTRTDILESRKSSSDDPKKVLRDSLEFAALRADRIYQRATYLLVSGVIMAIVGVGVFFTTDFVTSSSGVSFRSAVSGPSLQVVMEELLNDVGGNSVSNSDVIITAVERLAAQDREYVQNAENRQLAIGLFRSIGILFFLEAIAWFLLRQYRNQVEDHKWAIKQYLKRSNYLAALELAGRDRDQKTAIMATLLSEDMRGILEKEQTTEALESLKSEPQNPVFDLVAKLIDKADGAKASKE